jgi:nucleotide-binding universal stress UspA family protein
MLMTEIVMLRRLLLAYDGSKSAENALLFAVDLAHRYLAELHILTVVRLPDFANEMAVSAGLDDLYEHSNELLRSVRERLSKESITPTLEVAMGQPGEQIVRYAEDHGIDLILVGHRGHSLFEHWLIGSVARQVICESHCSVTVVR